EYLTRSGGEAEQKEIAKALGYSRLKTHRLIASLRRRNIVEVKPHGRTNLVKLHETSRNP
ncbi:MAG: helix-turn-helix domain-containing protein, partial [Candidatus Caldarchaeum sp.]|nr:helix-turn-helix domain-containing protein [Candidatus Caldarchaeum sp.]